jgi:hypothetical protein
MSPKAHWCRLLEAAAKEPYGGPRSFVPANDSSLPQYTYNNSHYENLFRQAATSTPASTPKQSSALPERYSAGWLVPDDSDGIECPPVFVANSTLSAIWLLHKTLPKDAVLDDVWDKLAHAANELVLDSSQVASDNEAPPSAQRPRDLQPISSKRRSEESPTASSKRAKTTEPADGEDGGEGAEGATMEADAPAVNHTVTNHNRRAEQRRESKLHKQRELQALKKRKTLGLIEPALDADLPELTAYNLLSPDDETTIAWIFAQHDDDSDKPFYKTALTPYATANTMLKNARAVGNEVAQDHAASFLRAWRSVGTPFALHTNRASKTASNSGTLGTPSSHDGPNQDFWQIWSVVNHYEFELAAAHIGYRWALALLSQKYEQKIKAIEDADVLAGRGKSRSRNGKGKLLSEAQRELLAEGVPNATKGDHQTFKARLNRGARWFEAAKTLGWGILAIIPYDQITGSWAEKTLRVGEWRVWLQLVKKVNPEAHKASQMLDAWFGAEGIAGGSIEGKARLYIEPDPSATTRQFEEVLDSEDEEDEDEGGEDKGDEDEDRALVRSPGSTVASVPPVSLVELFKPRAARQEVGLVLTSTSLTL